MYLHVSRPFGVGGTITDTFHGRSFTLPVGAGLWMQLDFLILETPTTSGETSPGGPTPWTLAALEGGAAGTERAAGGEE
jgi:hypothetical protein